MGEAVDRPFESPENVEIGRFGGQRHCRGRERGFAIESSAGENCAREEMSDGIQIDFLSQNEWLARRAQLLTFFSGASLKCGYVCACPRRESDFTDAVSAQQETR